MLEFPPIKDIAPPVEPSALAVQPWMWWVAAGVLVLILITGLVLWMRAVGRRLALPPLPPRPDAQAIRELEALRKTAPGLDATGFAEELSEIVRTFLHRQTGVLARYATSPELLGERPPRNQPPPPPVISAFREVLTQSDALKYGPANTDRTVQTDALIDAALAAIKSVSQPVTPPTGPPPLPAWVTAQAAAATPIQSATVTEAEAAASNTAEAPRS